VRNRSCTGAYGDRTASSDRRARFLNAKEHTGGENDIPKSLTEN
jgi:hypothetical protein